ncbi:MAG: hypothetical protein KME21_12275 [Desmonostoc vinosum HA7617-LM4]|nr:hypothetical protein [Desmonostoc vinosum HA7617-LM4]
MSADLFLGLGMWFGFAQLPQSRTTSPSSSHPHLTQFSTLLITILIIKGLY